MRANELRIGNLIGLNLEDTPENYFMVIEPAEESMKVRECGYNLDLFGGIHFIDACFFQGIPLSDQWHTRLGIKQIGMNKFECISTGIDLSCAYELKFVHQIQNLYYALMQEEIEITIQVQDLK